MTERDIKLLWGRSGNRCAICQVELSHDKKLSSEKFPLGEQAHIVGEKESAARGKSNLSSEERDGYPNRILLCPTHHTIIDRDEETFSVERLHFIKQNHELWVQSRLSERIDDKKQVEQIIYAALIDAAVKYCAFSEWNQWVSFAGQSRPLWREHIFEGVDQFHDLVYRAVWPKTNDELERSLRTLAAALEIARHTFGKHCDYGRDQKGIYHAVIFYSLAWHTQEVYDRLGAEYDAWEDECFFWLWISTKAANWFCDVVRRDINPMFFALEGRFIMESRVGEIPEFTVNEKKILPNKLGELFKKHHRKSQ